MHVYARAVPDKLASSRQIELEEEKQKESFVPGSPMKTEIQGEDKSNMNSKGRPDPVMDTQKRTGTCKWFNSQKGFGFITPDGGGPDVFVHQSVIKADGFRSLGDGERVEYFLDLSETEKDKAAKVTGLNGGNVIGTLPKPRFNAQPYSAVQPGYYQQLPVQMPSQPTPSFIWPGTSTYSMGSYMTGYTAVTQPPLVNYQNMAYVMKQTPQHIAAVYNQQQQRYQEAPSVQKKRQNLTDGQQQAFRQVK